MVGVIEIDPAKIRPYVKQEIALVAEKSFGGESLFQGTWQGWKIRASNVWGLWRLNRIEADYTRVIGSETITGTAIVPNGSAPTDPSWNVSNEEWNGHTVVKVGEEVISDEPSSNTITAIRAYYDQAPGNDNLVCNPDGVMLTNSEGVLMVWR